MTLSSTHRFRLSWLTLGVVGFSLLFGLEACSSDDDGDDEMNGSAGSMNGSAGSDMGSAGSSMGTAGSAGSGSMGAADPMTFFVSSTSGPDGGNFGGLEGADQFCQGLAEAAGSTGLTWRALLSTDTVDARDRIGSGPWHNADGMQIAASVSALFDTGIPEDDANADNADMDIKRLLLIDENGEPVSAQPLEHDILTGTNPDGTASDANCANWTSSSTDGSATVGHSDSRGPQDAADTAAWLSVHPSQGCDAASLVNTGGNGRIYCFAEN